MKANITLINSSGLLDLSKKNCGLIKSFTNIKASPEQEHDLFSFYDIGTQEFEKYISTTFLSKLVFLHPKERNVQLFPKKKDWQK